MEFAFIDETGEYGAKGSKYLTLVLLCTPHSKKLSKIIRAGKQRLLDKSKTARWFNRKGEIKAYGFPDLNLQKRLLTQISEIDPLNIYAISIRKNGKKLSPEYKLHILNFLVQHINTHKSEKRFQKIIADLNFFNREKENYFYVNKLEIQQPGQKVESFSVQQITQERYKEYVVSGEDLTKVMKIEHMDSKLSEELQALDLVCGAFYKLREFDNSDFFDIIKSKIALTKIIDG